MDELVQQNLSFPPSPHHTASPTGAHSTPPSSTKPVQLQQVSGLHFEDNRMVILITGNKEFRLPLCILTSKSTVFREQCFPDAQSIQSDGSLKFKLSDPPTHAEYFLRAVFDSGYFEPPPRKINDIDHVLGILDLSSRYGVGYLRKRALSHIVSGYPTTLAEWFNHRETTTFAPITDFTIARAQTSIHVSLMTLYALAKVGASWLMPAVFYQCGRYELQVLISHSTWINGPLNEKLKSIVLTGHSKQWWASRRVLGFLQRAPPENCATPIPCAVARRVQSEQLHACDDLEPPMCSPLTVWEDGDWMCLDVCEECMIIARKEHAAACEDFWMKLPEIYGLEGWDKLFVLRDVDMA
ncbi:hypothetical protein CPB83DRAFT_849859 [Crepidotus variabilis]|uniref:BTB domain-containing protein n=1 Tax=Crepidotus variabilis TaxID=179855 RepID=A0A9P6JSV4_9AGAR|nr:hypothetical protein CPB83DRAFT_849859 [Crepidotus variabilis]